MHNPFRRVTGDNSMLTPKAERKQCKLAKAGHGYAAMAVIVNKIIGCDKHGQPEAPNRLYSAANSGVGRS